MQEAVWSVKCELHTSTFVAILIATLILFYEREAILVEAVQIIGYCAKSPQTTAIHQACSWVKCSMRSSSPSCPRHTRRLCCNKEGGPTAEGPDEGTSDVSLPSSDTDWRAFR